MGLSYKEFTRRRYPIAAGENIAPNDTVCLDSGYAVPGQSGTTLRSKGVAAAFFDANGGIVSSGDNTNGNDGDIFVEVVTSFGKEGLRSFKRKNDPGAGALTAADVGSEIYVLDATGVTKTSSGNSVAGELDRIDDDGNPWVIFPISF